MGKRRRASASPFSYRGWPGLSVAFAYTGIFAVAFRFRYTATLNLGAVDGNGSAEMQRQLHADFLCDGKFAYLPYFTKTCVSGSDDGRTAADGRTGTGFGKRHHFHRYAY